MRIYFLLDTQMRKFVLEVSMYTKLRILMIKNQITIKDLSCVLNLSRNTISNKIRGKSRFSVEEFKTIQTRFFPNVSLEILSTKD